MTDREIADKEAENGLLQFDQMFRWIEESLEDGRQPLSPGRIREFQGLAVDGLEIAPGRFREEPIFIDGSRHVPPPWEEVPQLVGEMCDYLTSEWVAGDPLHLAAYVMWRLNWIHPFTNGNGRTSRVASYLILCAKFQQNLPGDRTIPDIIDGDKGRYYAALDDADDSLLGGKMNVSSMEAVVRDALQIQLTEALKGR